MRVGREVGIKYLLSLEPQHPVRRQHNLREWFAKHRSADGAYTRVYTYLTPPEPKGV